MYQLYNARAEPYCFVTFSSSSSSWCLLKGLFCVDGDNYGQSRQTQTAMNQSQNEAETGNQRQARENM